MQRRSFLKASLAAGTLGLTGHKSMLFGQTAANLTRYVDALPIPGVIRPNAGGIQQVAMSEFHQQLHQGLPPTRLWGYNGT